MRATVSVLVLLSILKGSCATSGMCDDAAGCASIHALFAAASAGQLRRTVEKTPKGYIATTTSKSAAVAARLHSHVEAMRRRVDEGRSINTWDPLVIEAPKHDLSLQLT